MPHLISTLSHQHLLGWVGYDGMTSSLLHLFLCYPIISFFVNPSSQLLLLHYAFFVIPSSIITPSAPYYIIFCYFTELFLYYLFISSYVASSSLALLRHYLFFRCSIISPSVNPLFFKFPHYLLFCYPFIYQVTPSTLVTLIYWIIS